MITLTALDMLCDFSITLVHTVPQGSPPGSDLNVKTEGIKCDISIDSVYLTFVFCLMTQMEETL